MNITLSYNQFTEIPYTSGTVQNINEKSTIEISTKPEPDTGLVLQPHEKYKWANGAIYARAKWSDGEIVTLAVLPIV